MLNNYVFYFLAVLFCLVGFGVLDFLHLTVQMVAKWRGYRAQFFTYYTFSNQVTRGRRLLLILPETDNGTSSSIQF